jgi:hypothetical protein
MYADWELREYQDEIRKQVCRRCIEKPPGGPPCEPLGKRCGIEMHLPAYLEAIREVDSPRIEPYLDKIRQSVCSECVMHKCDGCPCPMDYLLVLLVQAVETVDQRRLQKKLKEAQPVSG